MPPPTRRERNRMVAHRVLIRLSLALLVLSPVGFVQLSQASTAAAATRPNVVIIMTDDHRWDQISDMPTLQSELVGKGTLFRDAFAENPLCCPARTTVLKGQYSHTTGIWNNQASTG